MSLCLSVCLSTCALKIGTSSRAPPCTQPVPYFTSLLYSHSYNNYGQTRAAKLGTQARVYYTDKTTIKVTPPAYFAEIKINK